MRTRSALGILLATVLLLFIAAQTRVHDSQCKAEIASLEDRWLKAIEDADDTTLNQILGDDFVRPAPSTGQFITKSQFLAYCRSRKQMPSTGSKRIENLSVTLYGNTAIARGTVVSRDSSGRIVSKNLFTDVFVHRDDRWQAVSAQENAQQGTDD